MDGCLHRDRHGRRERNFLGGKRGAKRRVGTRKVRYPRRNIPAVPPERSEQGAARERLATQKPLMCPRFVAASLVNGKQQQVVNSTLLSSL